MTKSTKTILLALGGVAALAGAGTAIYYATKKPELVVGKGSTAGTTPNGGTKTSTPPPATPPPEQSNALPLELQSFANWLAQNWNSSLIDPDTLQSK